MQLVPQRRSDEAVIDLRELRMQYAQAVLDGDVLEESSVESTPSTFVVCSLPETLQPECSAAAAAGDAGEEWVDVTGEEEEEEEEEAVDGQKKPGHKQEDSGYSSGDDASTLKIARLAKWSVVRRRKEVRFDEEAIEKQR
jgi:hypothetical protein